jgi:hypothetical protein
MFGPFQHAWADRCDDIVEETGEEMPREQFVKHYMEVRQKTFKESTIINAFRKSGCWPINPDVFTDEDYSPSITTSTSLTHIHTSYPKMATQHKDDSDPESSDSDSNGSSDEHATNPAVHLLPSYPVLASTTTATTTTTTTSSFLPTPIPPSVFYAHTRSRSSKSHSGRVSAPTIQAENTELRARVTALESRVATAEAHAALARTEIQALKRKLNTKKDKTKRRKLNVEARWLNSDEGLRIAQEQEASRAAEEQRKREGREVRAAKQAEREEQRRKRDPNKPFTGSLTTKMKADLQDVAQVLGLTIDSLKKDLLA